MNCLIAAIAYKRKCELIKYRQEDPLKNTCTSLRRANQTQACPFQIVGIHKVVRVRVWVGVCTRGGLRERRGLHENKIGLQNQQTIESLE